jgi:putative restriction endonuclease
LVSLFVAVTDNAWFEFLGSQQDLDEVNFWQPGGRTNFRALVPGELFLFKLHSPHDFIVGGGVFAHASILPVSLAWDAFGSKNGARSLTEMQDRIAHYRRDSGGDENDFRIGCRILESPFFFPREQWIPVPPDWSRNIVVGKKYDTDQMAGMRLWDAIQERNPLGEFRIPQSQCNSPGLGEPRYGEPALVAPRLGQGTFRVAVTDAYNRRCSVTGERTLPTLEAAHIRPYGEGGTHEISNGLLFRCDIHRLFDHGYVTVSTDGRFEVSRRFREEFENGRQYYAMHGAPITLPERPDWQPSKEALTWHNGKFLG